MTNFRGKLGRVAIAAAACSGAVGFFGVGAASAAPINEGAVTLTPSSGGSNTAFSMSLPANAACPGDTSTDGYNVWGYLTYDNGTNGAAPASLTFSSGGGSFFAPAAGYASAPPVPAVTLTESRTNAWGGPTDPEATAINTGVIINLPTVNLGAGYTGDFGSSESAAFADQEDLFPGTWDIGIACTAPGVQSPAVYWNTQITLTASSTDPNGFTYAVVSPANTPEVPFAVVLPVSAIGIAGVGVLVLRRKRRPATIAS